MNNRKSDYYNVLNLNRDCDLQEIKKSYRILALKWHPDKQADKAEAHSKFNEIREAYSVLSDPKQRKMYDLYGHQGIQDNNGQSSMYFAKGFQGTEKSAFDILWDILQEKEDDSFDQTNGSSQMPGDFKTEFFGLFESRATSEVDDNHFVNNYQPTFTQTEFCVPPEEYTSFFKRKNSSDFHKVNSNFSSQSTSAKMSPTNTDKTRSNSGVFMHFSSINSPNESPRMSHQSTTNLNMPFNQKKTSIIVIDDDDDEAEFNSSDHSQQPVNPWIAQLNEFQVILDRFHNNLEENLNNMNKVSPNSKKIYKREKPNVAAQLAKNVHVDRFGAESIPTF